MLRISNLRRSMECAIRLLATPLLICFSFIVFQHMPNKKVVGKNFEEIKRVLKNNGIAKIQVRGLPQVNSIGFMGLLQKEIEKLVSG